MSGTIGPVSDRDEPLKRIRYFPGQLLTAEEFRGEQDYFRGRLQRHNRFVHGWGVTCGLDVRYEGAITDAGVTATEPHQGAQRNRLRFWVHPGFAISPQGEDISLARAVSIDLAVHEGKFEQHFEASRPATDASTDPPTATKLWLAIRATECPIEPVPALDGELDGTEPGFDYSRIREGIEIGILSALPQSHTDVRSADDEWRERLRAWRASAGTMPMPVPPYPPTVDDPWIVLATLRVKGMSASSIEAVGIDLSDRRILLSTAALQVALTPPVWR